MVFHTGYLMMSIIGYAYDSISRFLLVGHLNFQVPKAVCGLHQARVKFEQELIVKFKEHEQRTSRLIVFCQTKQKSKGKHNYTCLNADDFLHFTNDTELYLWIQEEFKNHFDVKSGTVTVCLGTRVLVDSVKITGGLNDTEFVAELHARLGAKGCSATVQLILQWWTGFKVLALKKIIASGAAWFVLKYCWESSILGLWISS